MTLNIAIFDLDIFAESRVDGIGHFVVDVAD